MKRLNFIVLSLLLAGYATVSFGQIDTEFWFVVPELSHRGNTGGTPGTLRFSTLELDASVTIEMPANPGFTPIVLDIAANDEAAVDLSYLIDYLPGNAGVTGLENKALTPNGINPFGLHITSTNRISAFWEVNYQYGADVWTLKGANGLGTLFYTPFQTDYPNHLTMMPSYSAIDVVASQDNTNITFTLPDGVGASYGMPMSTIPATTPGSALTIHLNRGETFSLFPYLMSTAAADRLAGSRVSSDNPIAVVIKDDDLNTASQGRSTTGDQIVPVDVAGDTYVVPAMGNPNLSFVVATQDNTQIYVSTPGSPSALFAVLDEGEQVRIQSPANTITVISSKNGIAAPAGPPIYVYHLAISNMTRASALLPPIGCTGNTQLSFNRARESVRENFYLFLITEDENIDNFLIDGVPADPTVISNDITNWDQLGNGWSAFLSANIPASKLSIGQHLVENTGGIFHLGIINGYSSANLGDLYYGYFSDYGRLNVGAVFAGTNSSVIRACYGTPVQLHAYGGTTYEWTPQDYLNDPFSNSPTAMNLPSGAHQYTAHVSGACLSGDVPLTVVVSPPVIADFGTDVVSGCSPLEVAFDDLSEGNAIWQYDLGDGTPLLLYDTLSSTPGIDPPPDPFSFTHTYGNITDSNIDYEISLLVRNESGCADLISRTITALPELHASFVMDRDHGCGPMEVQITNNSWGKVDTYLWSFGDGTTSASEGPVLSHTYVNNTPFPVTYTITLRVENAEGCFDQIQQEVTIYPTVVADFTVTPVEICSPSEILFQNNSTGASTYFWDFGDGGTSTELNPIHYYDRNLLREDTIFTVMLVATSNESCRDTAYHDVVIHPYIDAAFTIDDVEGCTPFEVVIHNESIGVDNYYWDFGDGTPVSNDNSDVLTHTYLNSGSTTVVYPLRLVVFNEEGCSDTLIRNITVQHEITADFTANVLSGCHPLTVNFSNLSVNAMNYLWDFGDGTTSNLMHPDHTFINTSNSTVVYTVKLVTIASNNICKDSTTMDISVYPMVHADYTTNALEGCHPFEAVFENTSENASIYRWDFGDGTRTTTIYPNPQTHTFLNKNFADKQVFQVSLEVENDFGCSDDTVNTVTVYRPSEGGTLSGGISPIVFGGSTGTMAVQGYYGDIVNWQKRLTGSAWTDTGHTETTFNDVPESAGVWLYRVQVRNEICPDAFSDSVNIMVLPKEVVISPVPGQEKKEGDPDPVFDFTNSEWNDNSNFTGQLEREPGETPGEYEYILGDLSAGSNYTLDLNTEGIKFTIVSTVGIDEYRVSKGLELSNYSNPFRESTTFRYSLPFDGRVTLIIYNMTGQVEKTLVSNKQETVGDYTIGLGDTDMDAGIYFAILRLEGDHESISKTIKLIKSR